VKTIEWNLLVVGYLFLGGLPAGIFFVSALATLIGKKDNADLSRISVLGARLAPWPVMIGCLLLMFDLGRWYRFYKLFLHVRWTSPMSIGSWLLAFFILVSLLNLHASLSAQQRARLVSFLPRFARFQWIHNLDLSEKRRALAVVGLPLSVGVGIYTGVLLGAVQSRPFWNTSLVAQLFLFSALSTGCAALLFVLLWQRKPLQTGEIRLLYTLDVAALSLELFIVLPYVIHGQLSVKAVRDSLQLIFGGPFTVMFWVFFFGFGLLLPLFMEIREIAPTLSSGSTKRHGKWVAASAAILVLAGGFLLRYIFVYAGQVSTFQ
jgi:formate-dependent nitrite reductase membrane component NrfD